MLPFCMFRSTNPTSRPSHAPRPQPFPTPSLFFHSPSSVNAHQSPQPFSYHGLTSQFSVHVTFRSHPLPTRHSPLATIFLRINTYISVSKQSTLSTFRMNTYAKQGGGTQLLLTRTSRSDRPDSDRSSRVTGQGHGSRNTGPGLRNTGHGSRNTGHGTRVTSSADWLTNSLSVASIALLRTGGLGSAATSLRVYSCRGE
jgi:hypothetical protein